MQYSHTTRTIEVLGCTLNVGVLVYADGTVSLYVCDTNDDFIYVYNGTKRHATAEDIEKTVDHILGQWVKGLERAS